MSIIEKIKEFATNFSKEREDEYLDYDMEETNDEYTYEDDREYVEEEREVHSLFAPRNNRMTRKEDPNAIKMQIFKPTNFEDAKDIIRLLKNKESVIMNLENINKEEARRIIDIVSGGVTALDGHIVKITNAIFIAAPTNYMIEGELEKRRKSSFNF